MHPCYIYSTTDRIIDHWLEMNAQPDCKEYLAQPPGMSCDIGIISLLDRIWKEFHNHQWAFLHTDYQYQNTLMLQSLENRRSILHAARSSFS